MSRRALWLLPVCWRRAQSGQPRDQDTQAEANVPAPPAIASLLQSGQEVFDSGPRKGQFERPLDVSRVVTGVVRLPERGLEMTAGIKTPQHQIPVTTPAGATVRIDDAGVPASIAACILVAQVSMTIYDWYMTIYDYI
jgi:hypothetical protein